MPREKQKIFLSRRFFVCNARIVWCRFLLVRLLGSWPFGSVFPREVGEKFSATPTIPRECPQIEPLLFGYATGQSNLAWQAKLYPKPNHDIGSHSFLCRSDTVNDSVPQVCPPAQCMQAVVIRVEDKERSLISIEDWLAIPTLNLPDHFFERLQHPFKDPETIGQP